MSLVHDIEEIYKKHTEENSVRISRNDGIIDFNERVLSEVNLAKDVPEENRLSFIGIVIDNLIEFIQTRYQEIKNPEEKMAIKQKIEDILEKCTKVFANYATTNKIYPLKMELSCLENKTQGQFDSMFELQKDTISIFDIGEEIQYYLSVKFDSDNGHLIKLYGDIGDTTPFILNTNSFIEKNRYFLSSVDTECDLVYSFRIIRNKNFPYLYNNDSDTEVLEDLYEIISIKNRNDAAAFIASDPTFRPETLKAMEESQNISNPFQIIDEYRNNFDDYIEKLFGKRYEIIHTKSRNAILNGFSLYHQVLRYFETCKKEGCPMGNYHKYLKPGFPIIVNIDRVNLFPGILFETPYVDYQTVLNLIHRECGDYHADEYKNKWGIVSPAHTKAIFMSIYRIDIRSSIVEDLVFAAKHGIKVFVYVEPLARDNEEMNIKLIKRLKKAGIHVISNYYGMKVHAKAFLSMRDDGSMIGHISTGNYDVNRAKSFTDYQFITQDPEICSELLQFFNMLIQKEPVITQFEYFGDPSRNICISPITLRDMLIDECEQNTRNHIFIKCNNLCDDLMIRQLYYAAERGIKLDVLCRTACSLVPKVSNIRVRSNTGKYLEHGRMYQFDNRTYISSADLLLRNLNKRIELMVRIPENTKILAKHGTDAIRESVDKHIPEIARDENTLESLNNYMARCFRDAKWKKNEDDYKFVPYYKRTKKK